MHSESIVIDQPVEERFSRNVVIKGLAKRRNISRHNAESDRKQLMSLVYYHLRFVQPHVKLPQNFYSVLQDKLALG